MIVGMLVQYGIPFRYEELLIISGNTYAPDFVLLRPKDRKRMYWEHFGGMDHSDYRENHALKMIDYRRGGILPSDNFIATYENSDYPFTMEEIETIIASQLL